MCYVLSQVDDRDKGGDNDDEGVSINLRREVVGDIDDEPDCEPSKVEVKRRRWRCDWAQGRSDNGNEDEENRVEASGGGERGPRGDGGGGQEQKRGGRR